ncbi:MAG: MBOAT family protein [Bacteroidales bacterium]|nr:MBOAT family protein [Bacteroidales bacterium]
MYFWIFFGIILSIYSIIYPAKAARNGFLFFASLFFYWKTSGLFFLLLIFSTIVGYFLGLGNYRAKKKLVKKLFVAGSIIVNLGLLSYFKYSYFVTETINNWFRTDFEVFNFLAAMSNSITGSKFDVAVIGLPVGISFFTFQTISYALDIYREKVKPVRNIIDFGFYVSFFPQLVAGPIVRASEFVPQLYKRYNLSYEEFGYALFLILNGLVKKMFIGDYLAVNFIDRIFANPLSYSGFENISALYAYSLQVYCDFSGYTDIAIGIALFLGFRLPKNFNSPYKADSVGNFWKRWHISLSSWLKDYLYIPLGGNKKGQFRTNVNLMLTMLLGGLWHGASWEFVIWGGINGLGLLVYKYWKRISPYENSTHWLTHLWKVFLTFNFITFTRIWFRSESIQQANQFLSQVWNSLDLSLAPEVIFSYYKVFLIMLLGYVVHWLPSGFKNSYRNWFINAPIWVKLIVTLIIIFVIYQSWSADIVPFIYFQF